MARGQATNIWHFLGKNGWTVQKALLPAPPDLRRVREIGGVSHADIGTRAGAGATLLFFSLHGRACMGFCRHGPPPLQRWHKLFQVVYDGQQPGAAPPTVEQTVDEVISHLKSHGVSRLKFMAARMGGACPTRMLGIGEMPIDQAIIDGGITPYQLPFQCESCWLRAAVLSKWRQTAERFWKQLFPPERFTAAMHPKKGVRRHGSLSQTFPIGRSAMVLVCQQL